LSIFGTVKPFVCEGTPSFTGLTPAGSVFTLGAGHGVSKGEHVLHNNTVHKVTAADATTITVTPAPSGTADLYIGYKFESSVFEYDMVQPDQINHRSIISGVKTNTFLGDYGEFKITERLWNKVTDFTAKERFQRLYSFYHTDVYLFPHSTNWIKDAVGGNLIKCYFKGLKPMYYKGFINYDAIQCEFETNKYHDVRALLV
jgi:hypothetical protein